jgi:hypothetical protein
MCPPLVWIGTEKSNINADFCTAGISASQNLCSHGRAVIDSQVELLRTQRRWHGTTTEQLLAVQIH